MLLLLVLALVGLVTATQTRTDSRVTGNTVDRAIAFQAAEAALREAESKLMLPNPVNVIREDIGFYAPTEQPPLDFRLWTDENSYEADADIPGIAAKPRYVIQQLGLETVPVGELSTGIVYHALEHCLYRVTAAAVGRSGLTLVVLQTTFRPPTP